MQCKQTHFKELVILKFTRKIVYFVTTFNTYMYCFNFVFLLHSFLFLVLTVSKNPQNTKSLDWGTETDQCFFLYNNLKISILGPEYRNNYTKIFRGWNIGRLYQYNKRNFRFKFWFQKIKIFQNYKFPLKIKKLFIDSFSLFQC